MITIIDYGMGNVSSIINMLKKLNIDSLLTSNIQEIERSEKIILPGVGSFDVAITELHTRNLWQIINKKALRDKVPVLGICLGMQLLCSSSEEGQKSGFGWINAECKKFDSDKETKLKVPCMGWNYVKCKENNLLFKGLEKAKFYFVHSYYVVCEAVENTIATAEYGAEYNAAIQKDNIYGVQFHPEKSHKYGMKLLKNFAAI
jgi:imidazole glycerol-phosphate synthase subunit HisH